MMDSGSSENQEEMVPVEAGVDQAQQDIPPQALAEQEPDPQPEVEKTLTDHLNKKLLESFLGKLDSGVIQFPPGAHNPEEAESDEFED